MLSIHGLRNIYQRFPFYHPLLATVSALHFTSLSIRSRRIHFVPLLQSWYEIKKMKESSGHSFMNPWRSLVDSFFQSSYRALKKMYFSKHLFAGESELLSTIEGLVKRKICSFSSLWWFSARRRLRRWRLLNAESLGRWGGRGTDEFVASFPRLSYSILVSVTRARGQEENVRIPGSFFATTALTADTGRASKHQNQHGMNDLWCHFIRVIFVTCAFCRGFFST